MLLYIIMTVVLRVPPNSNMEKANESTGAVHVVNAVRKEEKDSEVALVMRAKKRRWIWNMSYWQAVEAAFFFILIIVVWALFTLPTVFYLQPTPVKKVSDSLQCISLYM